MAIMTMDIATTEFTLNRPACLFQFWETVLKTIDNATSGAENGI
jgi:hypothetical protein